MNQDSGAGRAGDPGSAGRGTPNPDLVREEAERLVAAGVAAVSMVADRIGAPTRERGGTVAAGFDALGDVLFGPAGHRRHNVANDSPECCRCPVCRMISAARDPNPELVERFATGIGTMAGGATRVLRGLAGAAGSFRAARPGASGAGGEPAPAPAPAPSPSPSASPSPAARVRETDPWAAATAEPAPPPQAPAAAPAPAPVEPPKVAAPKPAAPKPAAPKPAVAKKAVKPTVAKQAVAKKAVAKKAVAKKAVAKKAVKPAGGGPAAGTTDEAGQ